MSSTRKQIAIFPDMPGEDNIADSEGILHADWDFFFQHLIMALQTNLKPEGFVIPPKPQSDVNQLLSTQSNNNVLYNNTTNQFIGNIPVSGTPSQKWMPFAMITNNAGDPNGSVAGQLYWFCWDTVGTALYICTTAGSSNGTPAPQAVWTAV